MRDIFTATLEWKLKITVHAEIFFVFAETLMYWFALQYLTVGVSIVLTILSLAKYFFVVFLLAIGYMWAKQDVLLYVPEPGENHVNATTAVHLSLSILSQLCLSTPTNKQFSNQHTGCMQREI